MFSKLVGSLTFLLLPLALADDSLVLVKPPSGPTVGFEIGAGDPGSYFAFLGIPYAQPPIGKLRFLVGTIRPFS